MPQWILLLAYAVLGWLLLTVVGGLVVGRVLAALSRYRRRSA